jgi:hypothetical protein
MSGENMICAVIGIAMWSRHLAGRQISNLRRVYSDGDEGDMSRMLERVVIGLAHIINELEQERH